MSKVAVVAKLLVQPGKLDEAIELLGALVDAANDEAGTELYVLHKAKDDPQAVWFYELYADDEALATHSSSDAMKAAFGPLAGVLAAPPELHILEPARAKGITTG